MARKLHHLTIRRGARTLAEGEADVDPDDGYDVGSAAKAVLTQAGHGDLKPNGLVVEIRHGARRTWVKAVTLR